MADKPNSSAPNVPRSTENRAISQRKLIAMGHGPKPSGPKTPA